MKLLDQIRQAARVRHFSIRTEKSYVNWAIRYIRFHGVKHPNTMGGAEIEAFLTHLAVEGNVASSTQNQALAALLFLYQEVLKIDVGRLDAMRARRPTRVPLVLSVPEVIDLLKGLDALRIRHAWRQCDVGCGETKNRGFRDSSCAWPVSRCKRGGSLNEPVAGSIMIVHRSCAPIYRTCEWPEHA